MDFYLGTVNITVLFVTSIIVRLRFLCMVLQMEAVHTLDSSPDLLACFPLWNPGLYVVETFACPLKKIEVNKIPNDRLEGVIRTMIKDLEKRKYKAIRRSDTDDFWIKIESLQWVLFVILAIKYGNMVVI